MLHDSRATRHALLPHPDSAPAVARGVIEELSVAVGRPSRDHLELSYRLVGELEALRLPDPRPAARVDGLWRHSCFEAFIGHAGAPDYWEYNFSPSGSWAAYHFTGYREGMAPLMKGAPPVICQRSGTDTFELEVIVDVSWLARTSASDGFRLGLAAVVEDKARVLSYWAVAHPAGKPDFHHADGFIVALE